jgi:hypothetical protein
MANQIIKQPNGKYCIFSSIVGNITHHNMDVEEIINEFVSEERNRIVERVRDVVNKLDSGEKPYHQFTKSYEQMLELVKTMYGEVEYCELKKLIEG